MEFFSKYGKFTENYYFLPPDTHAYVYIFVCSVGFIAIDSILISNRQY